MFLVDAQGGNAHGDAACRRGAWRGPALCLPLQGRSALLFTGMVVLDPLALFFKVLLIGASLLVILAFTFRNSRELRGQSQGEFYALLLAVTLSNVLLATSNDLAMMYLALEMVSITSYVTGGLRAGTTGSRAKRPASARGLAQVRAFGAVSTGAMLYGLSLLYGALRHHQPAPHPRLPVGRRARGQPPGGGADHLLCWPASVQDGGGALPLLVPRRLPGRAHPVTAILSVAPKAAGFAIMLRFFAQGMATARAGAERRSRTGRLLMVVSVLTMTVGNVAALTRPT